MEITGPFFDKTKRRKGQPRCWHLCYATSVTNPDGTLRLKENGSPIQKRYRPYYKSKAAAEADIPRIEAQHTTSGSGTFLFDRSAAADYEAALKITGNVPLAEVAKFWRLHHPDRPQKTCRELLADYIASFSKLEGDRKNRSAKRSGEALSRHVADLKSRVGAFVKTRYGDRYPETISKEDILGYVMSLDVAPRTIRNHKNSLSAFFGWMVDTAILTSNPAGGIRRKMLPRVIKKEVKFLPVEVVVRYLRAAERYAPDLVAHEIVQLIAGVRADDEMDDFRGDYVLPETREIVIPAIIAKTEKREVIQELEENFWAWWRVYGRKDGFLRPANYEPEWKRLRVLAAVVDQVKADELARLPIKTLLALPESKAALEAWEWNARRRTFCTYHVAKYQSADKTALILRHRGPTYTLHDSYRGLGVTQDDGKKYFKILPKPIALQIRPEYVPKGIVRIQAETKRVSTRP